MADQEPELQIVMRHIPGKNNVFADAASRRNLQGRILFEATCYRSNHQTMGKTINRYVCDEREPYRSKVLLMEGGPESISNRCISQSWSKERLPYAHPPIRLIPKVIQKFKEERIKRMILVLPHWPSLPIWPTIMRHQERPDHTAKNCIMGPPNHRLAIQNPTNDSDFATIPIDRDAYLKGKSRFTGLTETTLKLLGKGKVKYSTSKSYGTAWRVICSDIAIYTIRTRKTCVNSQLASKSQRSRI